MKSFILFISICSLYFTTTAQTESRNIRWFVNPEFSLMIHGDHLGNTVGFQTGISVLNDHLQIGFFGYGRSGPINPQEYQVLLPAGETYKGQSEVSVRADHGVFGLMIAPQFQLGEDWKVDIPLYVGQMGAGYYLFGDNRITPDGRRVSEWENELMGGVDAGFSLHYEAGIRLKRSVGAHADLMLGLHYALAPGWETFVGGTGFYNLPRVSVGVGFGG